MREISFNNNNQKDINKLLIIIFMVACFIMSACSEDEPKDRSELIRMWVSAETTETYVWGMITMRIQ